MTSAYSGTNSVIDWIVAGRMCAAIAAAAQRNGTATTDAGLPRGLS